MEACAEQADLSGQGVTFLVGMSVVHSRLGLIAWGLGFDVESKGAKHSRILYPAKVQPKAYHMERRVEHHL